MNLLRSAIHTASTRDVRTIFLGGVIRYWLGVLLLIVLSACKQQGEPTASPAVRKPTDLAGTTWIGTNEIGEQCEVQFRDENNIEGGFTFISPGETVRGTEWWIYNPADYYPEHDAPGERGKLFVIVHFAGDTHGSFRGELTEDTIVFERVTPFVLSIDLERLFGADYKGKDVAFFDYIERKGQELTIRLDYKSTPELAREHLELIVRNRKGQEPPLEPGPPGLGESSYVWPSGSPDFLSTHSFVRSTVFVSVLETRKTRIGAEDDVLEVARILDRAIRDEHPALSVVRLPKILRRK